MSQKQLLKEFDCYQKRLNNYLTRTKSIINFGANCNKSR